MVAANELGDLEPTAVGALVSGRWKVVARLAEGGMGVLYVAQDEKNNRRQVVLKFPKKSLLFERGFLERFDRETRSLLEFEHPHVVRVYDTGMHGNWPYVVLQYLPGGSLADHIRRRVQTPAELTWLPHVAGALDAIHKQGIIHRDVKAANILFGMHGEAYLSDFGIIKIVASLDNEGTLTQGGILGSPESFAPECVNPSAIAITPAYDQFGLAMAVYRALSGRHPFGQQSTLKLLMRLAADRPPPLDQVAHVPVAIASVVAKAMSIEPAARFASCSEFASVLDEALRSASGPKPHAESGDLRVSSEPGGAEIYLDGVLRGIAPLTVHGVEVNRVLVLRAALAQHADAEMRVQVGSGQSLPVTLSLRANVPPIAVADQLTKERCWDSTDNTLGAIGTGGLAMESSGIATPARPLRTKHIVGMGASVAVVLGALLSIKPLLTPPGAPASEQPEVVVKVVQPSDPFQGKQLPDNAKPDELSTIEPPTEALSPEEMNQRGLISFSRATANLQSDAEAVRWFMLAANGNDAKGQANLAFMYERGRGGLKANDAAAAKWYTLAAEQGSAEGQAGLGAMYDEGRGGLKRDGAAAAKWYGLAAEQGNASAQARLADMYRSGTGVVKHDDVAAAKWYRLAAEQGHIRSQNNLAAMYANGLGGLTKDDEAAYQWYRRAAEQGDAWAQFETGKTYEKGRGGLAKDEVQAVKWYKLAAEQGQVFAQLNLGKMYESGRGGLAKDETAAVELYKLAAQVAFDDAQENLSVLARRGNEDAQRWLAAQGLSW